MFGYLLLADAILVVHALFVLFVVAGELAVLLGWWRDWAWVRRPVWRWLHLGAILIVILFGLTLGYCPLTLWEFRLRELAGSTPEAESFVGRLVQSVLFVDLPERVLLPIYVAFALLVVATMFLVRPRPLRASAQR